jgi:hypothetical protein
MVRAMRILLLTLFLAVPAQAADPSFLEPSDHKALAEAMRWAEITESDLDFPRDYVNYGSKATPDRWRLPSAKAALDETMALPRIAAGAALSLTRDLRSLGGAPGWDGFFAVTHAEIPDTREEPCAKPPTAGAGLIDQVAALRVEQGNKWSKRELKDMKARLDPKVDVAVGTLLDEADLALCRVRASFRDISEESEAELLDVLDAMLRGGDEDPDSEAEGFKRFETLTAAWDATDQAALLFAARAWSDAISAAAVDLAAVPEAGWPESPMILDTPLGEVWLGSMGSNSGSGDPVLIVDPGGDDRWRIATSRDRLADTATRDVRGWIDLGGDDTWLSGDVGAGGALMGISAGIDLAGDDIYRAGRLSQGAAAFGVATWLDVAGDDRYDSTVAGQGFALAGAAILRDRGTGGDTYRADSWAQACGQFQGVAVLHEGGGNDHYVLSAVHEDNPNRLPGYFTGYGQGFAIGMRPYAGGGVAWLLDEAGHDRYTGGLWVQGSSYWHSLAALIDRSGNDLYTSVEYSQGSGIHLSAAGLFDGGGHDRYLTTHLGQGSGHDLAVSWLIDADGNDAYYGRSTVQGTSLTNAVSIFLDRQGDDTYSSRTDRWTGAALPARGWGSIALFVDAAGADAYLGRTAPPQNGSSVSRETFGSATDLGAAVPDNGGDGEKPWGGGPPVRVEDGPVPTSAEEAQDILLADVIWTSPRQRTEAAVDRVFRAGPKAVAWVLPLVNDQRLLQSYTVDRLVKRWVTDGRTADRERVAKDIVASATAWKTGPDVVDVRRHLAWLAGLAKAEPTTLVDAYSVAESFIEHDSHLVRIAALDLLTSISSIEGLELEETLAASWAQSGALAMQTDDTPEGRAAAARLLERVGGPGTASVLSTALGEGSFAVRGPSEAALLAIAGRTDGVAVARGIFPLAKSKSLPVRVAALRLLGATKHRDAKEVLEAALEDTDPLVSRAARIGMDRYEAD